MAQFNGNIPPPWQTRPQIQSSLLGHHPSTSQLPNPSAGQYNTVQQSIIQPPGLGSIQQIPQTHLVQHTMPSQQSGIGIGQPPLVQPPNSIMPTLIGQPNIASQSLVVSHPQLVQSQMQQIQPQVSTVSYPMQRAVNPATFNTQGAPQIINQAPAITQVPVANLPPIGLPTQIIAPNQSVQKQRVFTGSVTKICSDFGFVDEDVFFQTSCVKGNLPKVGDRVLVEAAYNPNMPFKWNANRIQVIPGGSTPSSHTQPNKTSNTLQNHRDPWDRPSFNNVPPPNFNNEGTGGFINRSAIASRARSPPRRDRRENLKRSMRDRAPERDEKEKDPGKRETRKRSRDRTRSRTPPRRRAKVAPRYNVQVPKIMLHMKEANVLELRKRYSNLYVPSDVFLTRPLWSQTFLPHRPFSFPKPVSFHVMSKEVDPVIENTAVYDAPDANYTYAAKVMLMSTPSLDEIYERSCALNDDSSESKSFIHPTRLINFLVGLKGKNETMAIGGYWSPSLDGANPESDPNVLIKTAVRTCKALTGIDLSACTTWYRIAEIFYRRGEITRKGHTIPACLETTVLFVPEIWNVCPTKLEWDGLQWNYRQQLALKLNPGLSTGQGGNGESAEQSSGTAEEKSGAEKESSKIEPSHWNTLDPKVMKVIDLRNELDARLLSSKGLKSQLIARLTKTLKTEQDKEESERDSMSTELKRKEEDDKRREEDKRKREEEERRREEEERKKAEERERLQMEKWYWLPDQPMILVHPSRTAKSAKFDCTTMSLSVLLDYRQEDNKEHSFEVSLFAELFNEMLMRDCAFKIYTALVEAPDFSGKSKEKKEIDTSKKETKIEEKDTENSEIDKKEKVEAMETELTGGEEVDKTKILQENIETETELNKETEAKRETEIEEKKPEVETEEDIEDEYEEEIIYSEEEREEEKRNKEETKHKDDSKKDKKRRDSRERRMKRRKMVTIESHLLLSFVYFDTTHTGYILDKDLEDIVNMLGLNLSRAQLKKLISKVVSRDALYYRKLTDVDERRRHEKQNISLSTQIDLEQLSKGNNTLMPSESVSESFKSVDLGTNFGGKSDIACDTGMVLYEGSLVDIGKLLKQLEKSDKARIDTEDKLKILQRENSLIKDESKKYFERSQKLSKELKNFSLKSETSEVELKKALDDNSLYQKALGQIKDVIQPLLGSVDEGSSVESATNVEIEPATPSKNGF